MAYEAALEFYGFIFPLSFNGCRPLGFMGVEGN